MLVFAFGGFTQDCVVLLVDLHRCALTQQRKRDWSLSFMCYFGIFFLKKLDNAYGTNKCASSFCLWPTASFCLDNAYGTNKLDNAYGLQHLFVWTIFMEPINWTMLMAYSIFLFDRLFSYFLKCASSFYIIAQYFEHEVKGELTNPNENAFMEGY